MSKQRKTWILIGILLGVAMYTLMQTIVATVMPIAAEQLGNSALYGWVFSGYLMMSTITIPIFSKLSDVYGYKKFFLIGMSAFLLGTLLCALSNSFEMLVFARVLQGIGAGALGPVAMALISNLYPADERGKKLALFAVIQLLANILGPVLGGVVASAYGWSAAFWFVLPLGLFSLIVLLFAKIPEQENNEKKIIDWCGALLLGGGITLFVQTWSVFEISGLNVWVLLMLIGSIILFLVFFMVEKKQLDPVISPEMIKKPNVSLASICALISGILNYGIIMMLPLLASVCFEGSQSFLLLVPLMAGVSIGMIVAGRLSAKLPYSVLVRTSWIFCGLSCGVMSAICLVESGFMLLFVFAFLLGAGLGILMPSIILPAQNAVSSQQQATVSGMIQLSRNVGGSVGIPIITGIIAMVKSIAGDLTAYGVTFLLLLFFCLIGLLLSGNFQGGIKEE